MSPDRTLRPPRLRARWAVAVALLVLGTVALTAQPAARWAGERALARRFGTSAHIEQVRLHPWSGRLVATGVTVGPFDRARARIPRVELTLRLGALSRGRLALSRAVLDRPEVWLALTPRGLAWADAGAQTEQATSPAALGALSVDDGRLHVVDRRFGSGTVETIEAVRLHTRPADEGRIAVEMAGRWRGVAARIAGWVRPDTGEFSLPVTASIHDPAELSALVPGGVQRLRGALQAQLQLQGRWGADWAVSGPIRVEGRGLGAELGTASLAADAFRLTGDVRWSPGTLALSAGRLEATVAELRGPRLTGTASVVDLGGGIARTVDGWEVSGLSGEGRLSQVRVGDGADRWLAARGVRLVLGQPGASGSIHGALEARGRVEAAEVRGALSGRVRGRATDLLLDLSRMHRAAGNLWQLAGSARTGSLHLDRLPGGMRALDGREVAVEFFGSVADGAARFQGRGTAASVDATTPERFVAGWHSGAVRADAWTLETRPFRLAIGTLDLRRPRMEWVRARRPPSPPPVRPGPHVRIARIVARDGQIVFTDRIRGGWSADIRDVGGEVLDIALDRPQPMHGRLEGVEQGGARLSVTGSLQPRTAAGDVQVEARGVDLLRLEAYYSPRIRRALIGGRGSAHLRVLLTRTGPRLKATTNGEVVLAPLELGDVARGDTFLSARRVEAIVDRYALDPLVLDVSAVAVSEAGLRVVRDPEGRLPVLDFIRSLRAAPAGATAAASPGAGSIHVRRLALADSTADIEDRSVRPAFRDRVEGLQAIVEGLSAPAGPDVQLQATGTLSDRSTFSLTGRLVPGGPVRLVDLDGAIRELNVPRLNPYAARLTSEPLEAGKLSGEIHYRIRGSTLEGQNHVRIDQLRVGQPRGGPDRLQATLGMPLAAMAALLADPAGEIRVSVPVTGDLGNPRFHLGDAIGTAARHAVARLVLAPFRLVGRLITGAHDRAVLDIAPVRFDPGSAALDADAEAHVDGVAAALRDRPQVKVKLTGVGLVDSDVEALREQALAARLARFGAGDDAGALAQLFRETFGPAAPLPAPETQRQQLRAAQPVTADALQQLVRARAEVVYEALIARGVDRDRLFLGESRLAGVHDGGDRGPGTDISILDAGG